MVCRRLLAFNVLGFLISFFSTASAGLEAEVGARRAANDSWRKAVSSYGSEI